MDFENAKKVSFEQGRAEEREKAAKELAEERTKAEAEKHAEKIEAAKKMLAKCLDIPDIADFTGLTIGEIQSL